MSWFRLVTAFCALLFSACSAYERKWNVARAARPSADPVEGAYLGTWDSARYEAAGGKLKCIVTRKGRGEYLAEFRATWHGIFTSTHSVILRATAPTRRGNGAVRFSGEAAISMWIGSGTYRCEGMMVPATIGDTPGLVPARITARYHATYDSGTFDLAKVSP
jgi:hypothetical protein